ncbi:MAG: YigZ family protein [Collinsella sp.]|nr:YigZ family protein [Collinsella sp.]
MESYVTLRPGREAVGEFTDRKSRFIAQLVHVADEGQAASHISSVRARHFDARHNVPAWILADGSERASDDGEPQRTSGMPTLEVLRGAGLRDVCCVTTRYFGGTLLGPGGLVRAYTAAAQAAIEDARAQGALVEMTSVVTVEARIPYPRHDQVVHLAQGAGAHVVSTEYTDVVTMRLAFREGDEHAFIGALTELMGGAGCATVEPARFAEF